MNLEKLITALRGALTAENDLTIRQLMALFVLYSENRTLDMGEFRRLVLVSNAVMCRVIDNLSISGYATRKRNEKDCRKRDIAITKEGKNFVEKVLG